MEEYTIACFHLFFCLLASQLDVGVVGLGAKHPDHTSEDHTSEIINLAPDNFLLWKQAFTYTIFMHLNHGANFFLGIKLHPVLSISCSA